jgi:pimeloyl-ACP methyl ester carboxylesterase
VGHSKGKWRQRPSGRHSFGGLVALAVALRNRVRLASLVIIEAPAVELLRESGEQQHYRAFRRMTETYFAAYERGDAEAIAAMIDFYGGAGTFASWPPRVRQRTCRCDKR